VSVATSAPDMTMATYKRWPIEFVSGRGAVLVDDSGREYIDCVAGIAVASVGHAHPRVASAIAAQARKLIHVSNLYVTEPQTRLAQRLADLTGGMRSFFTNSGAETIECAIKLARRWAGRRGAGRHRLVAATGGFHGRTLGALTATGQPGKQKPFEPLVPGFVHVDYDDVAALRAAVDDSIGAVILEPIQGEAGVVVPSEGYLRAARELCEERGALLVFDEVQTGLGRTGDWFASQFEGVEPDVMCLAKSLAGGLPMGACLATPEVASAFEPGDHATTFGGGPVQAAAALTVLDVIEEEGLVERARVAGRRLSAGLRDVFGDHEIRGRGLMIAVDLGRTIAREVAERALQRGLLVNDATPSVLRLTPPLVISDAQIDEAVGILGDAWQEGAT
jgi:predicted acetylornithine/succinylornithine family transaminase